jgi:hypothetical protein
MQYTEYERKRYSLVNSFWFSGSENATRFFGRGRRVHNRSWSGGKSKTSMHPSALPTKVIIFYWTELSHIRQEQIYPPGLHADTHNPGYMLSNFVQPIIDAAQRLPS